MARGKVKWFNDLKGYGFITSDDMDEKNLYVHHSEIRKKGYKTLKAGEAVEFDVAESPQGLLATNVVLID